LCLRKGIEYCKDNKFSVVLINISTNQGIYMVNEIKNSTS
jgi:hypothetical protein